MDSETRKYLNQLSKQANQKEIAEFRKRDHELFTFGCLVSVAIVSWPILFLSYPISTLFSTASLMIFAAHKAPKLD